MACDPAVDQVDAREAVTFLRRRGYDQLLRAMEETATANGRLNKLAIARRLGITTGAIRRRMEEMRELLGRL